MRSNIAKKLLLFLTLLMFSFILVYKVYAASATLKLSPASGTYKVGDTFDVKINLDTGGARTSGTDIYLSYDPEKLEVQDIVPGTIYSQYVGKSIDTQNGKVSLSGLVTSANELFEGAGTFAIVKFKALTSGTAEVKFDFTPEERNDCNVADFDDQNDALTSATNGSYTIVFASPSPTPVGGGEESPTAGAPELPVSALPRTVNEFPTFFLGLASLTSIILGIGILLFLP